MVHVFSEVHERNLKVLDEFTVDQTGRIRIFLTNKTDEFHSMEGHFVEFKSFELQEPLLDL